MTGNFVGNGGHGAVLNVSRSGADGMISSASRPVAYID